MLGDQEDPDQLIEPDEELEMLKNRGFEGRLSYREVKKHQYKHQPMDRDEKKKFNWCRARLNSLPFCSRWIKRATWVTPCAKEIGLGPTLFLLS